MLVFIFKIQFLGTLITHTAVNIQQFLLNVPCQHSHCPRIAWVLAWNDPALPSTHGPSIGRPGGPRAAGLSWASALSPDALPLQARRHLLSPQGKGLNPPQRPRQLPLASGPPASHSGCGISPQATLLRPQQTS